MTITNGTMNQAVNDIVEGLVTLNHNRVFVAVGPNEYRVEPFTSFEKANDYMATVKAELYEELSARRDPIEDWELNFNWDQAVERKQPKRHPTNGQITLNDVIQPDQHLVSTIKRGLVGLTSDICFVKVGCDKETESFFYYPVDKIEDADVKSREEWEMIDSKLREIEHGEEYAPVMFVAVKVDIIRKVQFAGEKSNEL